MDKFCDLHTHSVYSDGTCTPEELVNLAEEIGLGAIALCDHNTVAGLPEFLAAAESREMVAIPGVEISTDYQGTELHILGLFLPPESYGPITEKLESMVAEKDWSNRCLTEKLTQAGLPLDYGRIKETSPDCQVNRAVIGAEMVRLGYVNSVKEAFERYLSVKRGFYIPPSRPDALEIIRFLKSQGAVAVLAHPFLNLKQEANLRSFLTQAVPAGLDGMEVRYPLFDVQTTRLAENITKDFGLLPSGGSDFHGSNKPDISLGTGKGNVSVPISWCYQLQQRKYSGEMGK